MSRSATTPAGPIRSNIGSESAAPSWIVVIDASASPMPAPRPASAGRRGGVGGRGHGPSLTDGRARNDAAIMPRAMTTGHDDLLRAAETLAARVPEPLGPLARLAYNYRWSWSPDGHDIFAAIDPARWERCGENPVRLLQEAAPERLERAAGDGALLERIAALDAEVRGDLERPAAEGPATPENPVAYFCAEFGVHKSLPVYSGGLGALAGDILKEASDRALPLVAIGLLYRQGYFRQRIDAGGWQHEYWVDTDPERLPAALVTGPDGAPLTITVPVRGLEVTAQIWRVDVGRVPLFLLDTERPENDVAARWITSRLYIGEPDRRLAQYILLGVGGVRALEALGDRPRAAASQRGPRGVHLARGGAGPRRHARRRHRGGAQRRRSSRRTRPCRRATTRTRPTRSSRRWPA